MLLKIAKLLSRGKEEVVKIEKEKEEISIKLEKMEGNYKLSVEKWKNCKERLLHSEKELKKTKEIIDNFRSTMKTAPINMVIDSIIHKEKYNTEEPEISLNDLQFPDVVRVRTQSPFKIKHSLNLMTFPGVQEYVED